MKDTILTKNIGIIGTGAVGSALAVLLQNAGYSISGISGRNKDRSVKLAEKLKLEKIDESNDDVISGSDIIFYCLPDDLLSGEINQSADKKTSLKDKIFYHTSGALSSNIFEPYRKKGAHAASFHPLQTIPGDSTSISLKDFAIALEGDRAAVDFAYDMVQRIGAKPMLIEEGQKVMYHAAATIASNGLVGLTGVVEEMINDVGLGEEGREHFYKLMSQSLDNSRSMTPPDAITGPAARGDIATLKKHLNSIRQHSPHIVPIYVVIGSHCVSLAIRSGKLSKDRGEAILDMFSNELQSLTM